MKRKGLGAEQRNYHSLQWLLYAYLQEGRYPQARAVIADVEGTGVTRGLSMMKVVYALESGKMDDTLNPAAMSQTPMLLQSVAPLKWHTVWWLCATAEWTTLEMPSIQTKRGSQAPVMPPNRSLQPGTTPCPCAPSRPPTARPRRS